MCINILKFNLFNIIACYIESRCISQGESKYFVSGFREIDIFKCFTGYCFKEVAEIDVL